MSIRFDRLAMIAGDVRRAPASGFDMGKWRSHCGTVGCAIGWHTAFHPDSELKLWRRSEVASLIPVLGELQYYEAVAAYCGITEKQAEHLFCPENYDSFGRHDRDFVASRIEQFIRDHRESPVIEMKAEAVAPVAARQLEGEGT